MEILTGNQQLVKQINKNLVLDTIKKEAPISRAHISQKLGLNKGTVSSLVNELIEEQLTIESGTGKSSGGRKPVMLLFNEKAGYSIGIDLGVNYILGVLTDLQGNIVTEIRKNVHVRDYDSVLHILKLCIQDLISASPSSYYGIIGIGIGVPGLVNNEGEIFIAPNLGWKNTHLNSDMEESFHIPVIIENEANAGAYGEKLFGAGKNHIDILYVSAGIGIGVGIILKGELFTGMRGFAGEMGHMIIRADGKKCSCGSQGCWELYASEHALLEEAEQRLGTDKKNLSLEQLVELAEQGNEIVLQLFHDIGKYMAIGINNMINTFNPEQIIIGNRLALAKPWITDALSTFIRTNTLSQHQKDIKIDFSKLSSHSAAFGVSAMSIGSFLKGDYNKVKLQSGEGFSSPTDC
ncbi:ROK family transcriptional regulator [Bacillus niameyensis]|uniref:ROK family transcriptional regulator n=1 Tax=Bacillus niameyensis TaxID=1522308 RepID=UPI0007838A6F|nr:ROK family transcriptional regulator [Bacillus niameyensis]